MYQHILVPLDGSALSEVALSHAAALAKHVGARVTLLRAAHLPASAVAGLDPMGGPIAPELLDEALQAEIEEARDYLTRQVDHLRGDGLTADWVALEGEASQAILDTARGRECDLVAMATHGRTGLMRMVLGSVADRVLRESHLPVLLVRPPVAAATD